MVILFFILVGIVFYSYIGYGLLLWILTRFKKKNYQKTLDITDNLPSVTLIIPAYNEMYIIDGKMENVRQLIYPKEKLKVAWITDGSNDNSNHYLQSNYPDVLVWHQNERKGKAAALNRAIDLAQTEFLVFCDANTMLNKEALLEIVKHFENDKVGGVAGEKRVSSNKEITGSGESLYWRYESWLKQMNSLFYTSIGAVGELFAIRKSVAYKLPEDTIVDDFVLSMNIASKGYMIVYESNAYAIEEPSENEKEEMKRKVRIAAGAFQAFFRYLNWLNFLKNPILSFQYFSYKVLRWLFVPLALPLIFILNFMLVYNYSSNLLFWLLLIIQITFYLMAFMNLFFTKLPQIFYVPYYFILMNVAQYIGFYRYITKKQSAAWEKVKRKI